MVDCFARFVFFQHFTFVAIVNERVNTHAVLANTAIVLLPV